MLGLNLLIELSMDSFLDFTMRRTTRLQSTWQAELALPALPCDANCSVVQVTSYDMAMTRASI